MRITTDDTALCAALEFNIAEEAVARQHYYEMIERFAHLFDKREMRELEEIIAEELKHSEMLTRMARRRVGIVAED